MSRQFRRGLLAGAFCMLAFAAACGLDDDPRARPLDLPMSEQRSGTSTPQVQVGESTLPPSPAIESGPAPSSNSYIPAAAPIPPFHGDSLVEQKIINNSPVVRATMTSFSSEIALVTDDQYGVVLKFNLDVAEYLRGSGPPSIVAVWVDGKSYETRGEADVAKAIILARRDDQWDDREAIIFLFDGASGFGALLDGQLQRADHFLLALGDPYSPDDRYSLHSRVNKDWLPAVSGVSTTGDGREFLLDVPGSGSTLRTITLGGLKTRITEVMAEFNGGDGSEAYKECVRNKYAFEREARYAREVQGRDSYADSPLNRDLMSGLPARTMLAKRNWYGAYPDVKARTWLEGRDGVLFSVEQGEATPNDSTGDGVLTAGVDETRYMESFLTVRPLPAGRVRDRPEGSVGRFHPLQLSPQLLLACHGHGSCGSVARVVLRSCDSGDGCGGRRVERSAFAGVVRQQWCDDDA